MVVAAISRFCCGAAFGDALILPTTVLRDVPIHAVYRFEHPVTGHGRLEADWTDVDGRVVERRRMLLDLANVSEVQFSLNPSRAVTVKNEVAVRISLDETGEGGVSVHREHRAAATLIVSPPGNAWSDYQIIMWQRQTPAGYAALKRLGITGGMVLSDRLDKPGKQVINQLGVMLDADLRWCLENTATDFYASYHRWTPGRPVNWRFIEAKRRYWTNPRDIGAFFREPSLSDPLWLGKIRNRLISDVRALRRYRPLYYNLADEPGIADLTAYWDFDLSPVSLAAMRQWLKMRYGDLPHLNAEWRSAFRSWDDVVPMTTNEALKRTDQNFAPWGDFKEWMDVSFARALKSGSDAVHAADPKAVAAIEGGQIPGWGGYDYWRLATSVDAMELYDSGDNVEMLRSFNPNAVMLTTAFRGGAAEEHRVWRELLRGTRGLILWDRGNQFVAKDGTIGDRGRAASPYFQEIRDGLGALLINSPRHEDPIAILYSPASLRVAWLLDRIRTGEDWTRRSAGTEDEDNPIRVSMRNFARAIEHMGLQHRLISAQQIENGDLTRADYRVLILPKTISLSERTADEIRNFVQQGGSVIADGEPGIFDAHGRRRKTAALASLFPHPAAGTEERIAFGRGEAIDLSAPAAQDLDGKKRLRNIFAAAGIEPKISLVRADGQPPDDIETYIFENGGVTIVALLHDLDAASGAAPRSATEAIELKLRRPYQVYDVRAQRALGLSAKLPIKVGPIAPLVLALSEQPLPEPSISGPTTVAAGETADFRILPNGHPAAARAILHIEVTDPAGDVVPHYEANLLAPAGMARYTLPMAVNDKVGLWTINVRDLLSGAVATAHFQVEVPNEALR